MTHEELQFKATVYAGELLEIQQTILRYRKKMLEVVERSGNGEDIDWKLFSQFAKGIYYWLEDVQNNFFKDLL